MNKQNVHIIPEVASQVEQGTHTPVQIPPADM